MTDSTVTDCLAYYARYGAALFPIPAGQKAPSGIVASWKKDYSRDPAQWTAWQAANPNCNFGVVAFASNWIIADVDTSGGEAGRTEAWTLWCELCASWGIAPVTPQVQSARGGWHIYFAVPAGVDAAALRQPDAIKKRVNIRCLGFTVAAGSYFVENAVALPYLLMSDAAPYPAPEALIRHCTRVERTPSPNHGTRDRGDVAALMTWLAEREAFTAYEDWLGVGMALKLEFGDDGLALWQMTHDSTVTGDVEETKWNSFASDPTPGVQTLSTWLDRAHKLGWRGTVRKSASALFGGVAQIAAAAGASLHVPGPANAMPMMAGQEALTDHGRPILLEFLAATVDAPARPAAIDFPTLPESLAGHGLHSILCECIARIMALAETKPFKPLRVTDALAVLSLVHVDVFESLCRRLRAMGHTLPDRKIKLSATALADKVEREFVKQDDWIYDLKGEPQNDNSDNVAVFLGILGAEIRWNAWLERAELRGGLAGGELYWPEWMYIDDAIVAKLRTRANRTKTRFRPGKDFFWESLIALAQANSFDPVRDMLDQLAAEWDGQPRLVVWLSAACGVPCDPYHQAVARNVIGGLVRRIREPGCKHDFMPVFYGPQGTGKSTMARLLAINSEWFSDEIMLGDQSKELVLSLAGKSVVEVSEMGMRGSANPNHVKAMLSRQVDRGRTAYARTVTDRPRRNIFIGTTNDDEPLVDPTGNRRFLPVRVDREVNTDWLRDNIRQIVGEAARMHAAGTSFDIPRDVWGVAAEHQEAARSSSDVETLLNDWFAPGPYTSDVNYILASDFVWLTQLAGWRHGGATAARGAIMKRMGFVSENIMMHGKRTKLWARKPDHVRPADIPRLGVRYVVSADTATGRPNVTIRKETQPTP